MRSRPPNAVRILAWVAVAAAAQEAPSPAALRVEAVATFESAGLRLAAAGRAVADFAVAVRFRERGGAWRPGMDLVAVPAAGEWRGSLLGLRPDTEYEAECALRPAAAPPDAPPANVTLRILFSGLMPVDPRLNRLQESQDLTATIAMKVKTSPDRPEGTVETVNRQQVTTKYDYGR